MSSYSGKKVWLPLHPVIRQKVKISRFLPAYVARKTARRRVAQLELSPTLSPKIAQVERSRPKRGRVPIAARQYKRPATEPGARRYRSDLSYSRSPGTPTPLRRQRVDKRGRVPAAPRQYKRHGNDEDYLWTDPTLEPPLLAARKPARKRPTAVMPPARETMVVHFKPVAWPAPPSIALQQELPPSPKTKLPSPPKPKAPSPKKPAGIPHEPFSPPRAKPALLLFSAKPRPAYKAPQVVLEKPSSPKKLSRKPSPPQATELFYYDEEYDAYPAQLLPPPPPAPPVSALSWNAPVEIPLYQPPALVPAPPAAPKKVKKVNWPITVVPLPKQPLLVIQPPPVVPPVAVIQQPPAPPLELFSPVRSYIKSPSPQPTFQPSANLFLPRAPPSIPQRTPTPIIQGSPPSPSPVRVPPQEQPVPPIIVVPSAAPPPPLLYSDAPAPRIVMPPQGKNPILISGATQQPAQARLYSPQIEFKVPTAQYTVLDSLPSAAPSPPPRSIPPLPPRRSLPPPIVVPVKPGSTVAQGGSSVVILPPPPPPPTPPSFPLFKPAPTAAPLPITKKSTVTGKPRAIKKSTNMPNYVWRTGGTQRQRMWGGKRGSGRMRYQAKWMGSIPQQAAWQRIASGPGTRMPKRRNYTYKTKGGRAQHAFQEAERYTHENLRGLVSMPYMHSHPGYLRQIGHRYSETRPIARAYKRVWHTSLPVGASRAPAILPNVYYHPVRKAAPRKKKAATGLAGLFSAKKAAPKKKPAARKGTGILGALTKAPRKKAAAKTKKVAAVVNTPAGPAVVKMTVPKKALPKPPAKKSIALTQVTAGPVPGVYVDPREEGAAY